MSAENQKNSNKLYALMLGLISIILTIVPTPDFLENFKPDWTLLLLIFLSINIPKEFINIMMSQLILQIICMMAGKEIILKMR